MKRLDPTGECSFSDFHEGQGQQSLFTYSDEMLAEDLAQEFSGQKLLVSKVWHHVLTRTPGVNFNAALTSLEKAGRLFVDNPPPGRRRGSFAKYRRDNPPLDVRFV